MTNSAIPPNTIPFAIRGQKLEQARRPPVLIGATRSAPSGGDGLLDCIHPVASYDLSSRARSVAGGETRAETTAGQVIALELDGGFTLFTSPERLRHDIRRNGDGPSQDVVPVVDAFHDERPGTRGVRDWVARALSVLRLDADAVYEAAAEKARELGADALLDRTERVAGWAGTKALMWAIESRIGRQEGLHRWIDESGRLEFLGEPDAALDPENSQRGIASSLEREASRGALLVFVHGTGSNTAGSFGELRLGHGLEEWGRLRERYGRRIFAFEHRTFSESPIANALDLARSLPAHAEVHLVTHSRGGLIGDLLCLPALDAQLVASFGRGQGDRRDPRFTEADAQDRQQLLELGRVLAEKQFRVERYARIASPSRGSLLLSGHLDAFLSVLLNALGLIPGWGGNPLYTAFKRIVLEIIKNRTAPELVPGIEAMLPESPLTRLLSLAQKPATPLAIIAGDIEGETPLKRIGVFLTDALFFEHTDNDLVIETDSMFGGIAGGTGTRYLFEQGRDVSHFRYLANRSSRRALADWLTLDDLDLARAFTRYDDSPRRPKPPQRAARSTVPAENRPAVFVIPGIMGSHLRVATDRVWFDFLDLSTGGLEKISAGKPQVAPDDLFDMFYGDLCDYLDETHEVHRFPYDWRESVFSAGGRLAVEVDVAIRARQSTGQPVRLLAHSMGGLVVRAMISGFRATWDRLAQRKGARFVMLGTPNRGSHAMVETLVGKGDSVRQLARLDIRHDLAGILEIVAGFRGVLELLPHPKLPDAGMPGTDYFDARTWQGFRDSTAGVWFSDGAVAQPDQTLLKDVKSNWGNLPEDLPNPRMIAYVAGQGANTPCGVDTRAGRLQMVGTPRGDGTVTWQSGLLDGIDHWFMPGVPHGELADTEAHFPAILELLTSGATYRLPRTEPAVRGIERLVRYDATPVLFPSEDEFARGLLGARPRARSSSKKSATLRVYCHAADLRQAGFPVLVGHYEEDAISGAEASIDRALGNALSMRKHLGLYAGPVGSATVVLPDTDSSGRPAGRIAGTVVIGLGRYGALTNGQLTEAVRSGAMRYLLQWIDNHGGIAAAADSRPTEIGLTSFLIGYNSTTNLSIEDSVYAIVRGVAEANRRFAETLDYPVRIGRLELIECYLDTAISATKALQKVAQRLATDAGKLGVRIDAEQELRHGEGVRQRLDALGNSSYWPRLIVTDADRKDASCPPECLDGSAATVSAGSEDAAERATTPGAQRSPVEMAARLRFVYLGQRARAETVVQQRQPGLVETLVAKAIRNVSFQPDLSRTLFQLLVPYDFKEAARQADRLVLVVDGYTANLPWEMISGDETPLAIQTPMVRQLASSRYRLGVRSGLDRVAYVVGNPSTSGFAKAFGGEGDSDPDSLPGAEAEAQAVAARLQSAGFEVEEAAAGTEALDVINKLYAKPYRILHIAAHGVYDAKPVDGKLSRSGVILSDGLLLTAAEIGQMESVPDLVFLNCCFLGKIDRGPVAYNRLAYSVARELIEMGVRGVLVAGWAVDDGAGKTFAEVFYDEFLRNGATFGLAVHRARTTVYNSDAHQGVNTWGAYQAYGDPDLRLDPQAPLPGGAGQVPSVSPEELLDHIRARRSELEWSEVGARQRGPDEVRKRLEKELNGYPQDWRVSAAVLHALGCFYAELGDSGASRAIGYLRQALAAEDGMGRVPLCAVEVLARTELAEARRLARGARDEPDGQSSRADRVEQASALIDLACRRLIPLMMAEAAGEDLRSAHTARRGAMLGAAYELLAALRLESRPAEPAVVVDTLHEARRWYAQADHDVANKTFDPLTSLHWLQLQAVLDGAPNADFSERAEQIMANARERSAPETTVPEIAIRAEMQLVDVLASRALFATGAKGTACADRLDQAYRRVAAIGGVESGDAARRLLSLAAAIEFSGPDDDRARSAAGRLRAVASRLHGEEQQQRTPAGDDLTPDGGVDSGPPDTGAEPPDRSSLAGSGRTPGGGAGTRKRAK